MFTLLPLQNMHSCIFRILQENKQTTMNVTHWLIMTNLIRNNNTNLVTCQRFFFKIHFKYLFFNFYFGGSEKASFELWRRSYFFPVCIGSDYFLHHSASGTSRYWHICTGWPIPCCDWQPKWIPPLTDVHQHVPIKDQSQWRDWQCDRGRDMEERGEMTSCCSGLSVKKMWRDVRRVRSER